MRHGSYLVAATASHQGAVRDQKTKRRSIFASVLEALHDSRRLQAQHILRQYQHLIAQPKEDSPHNLISNIGGHKNVDE